jgi:hypothetical protein
VNKSNGILAQLLALALATFLLSSPLAAKEKPEWRNGPMGDRFYGFVGLYRPSMRTQAAISDAGGNVGALISFEDTLGLSDSEGTAIVGLGWQISKRNSLSFNYFKLDRSSTQDSVVKLIVDDPPLERDFTLPLSSVFNIESMDITYSFSAIANEKHNLGIGLGLAIQDLQFGFRPSENCDVSEFPDCALVEPREATATAPLPTLKLLYRYAINDKWIVDASLGYFALSLELDNKEDLSGRIVDAGAGVTWKTWKNVGFKLGYKYFDVDLEYAKRDLRAEADYDYRGFVAGIEAYY